VMRADIIIWCFTASLFFFYVVMAFVTMELNPIMWGRDERAVFITCAPGLSIFVAAGVATYWR
jgi:hypothetical protein